MAEIGYVMNATKLWSHQPALYTGLFEVLGAAARASSLSVRQRGILVTSCASTLGDAYCSLAWGQKLAGDAGAEVAGDVLRGDDDRLDQAERALAGWARRVTGEPNAIEAGDLDELRQAGYDDAQILAITVYVALRIAFSTVNDALGARPDRALAQSVPAVVRDAVTYGRPASTTDD